MKKIIIVFLIIICSVRVWADVSFKRAEPAKLAFNAKEQEVVHSALAMFQQDFFQVFDSKIDVSETKGTIILGTYGINKLLDNYLSKQDVQQLIAHEESFLMLVKNNYLIIAGSDKRGTAYGILELSRMIGVSPWEWWADSPSEKRDFFTLKNGYRDIQYPSVARRGIFINDEDWGLMPWASKTYEPTEVPGRIGPQTHARIFELLLRLRANTFWPAMHACSEAFYLTPGNKEMADKYGIYVGTSHCEPMVCNANAEWHQRGEGDYNFNTNKDRVLEFWKERVTELSTSDNIYTLGMRGVHDGRMEGAKTAQEQKEALADIIKNQREILAQTINPELSSISQVFIPYKEVLKAYQLGLEVPEDVTLMWTDDNYGYIRHFPNSLEKKRKGGNGIYYHISYWGRPHDYLWLATTHPALIYNQMKMAYNKGAKEMWIVNVGDIKPAEYLIEFFMDLAWNINGIEGNKEGLEKHLYDFYNREFGEEIAHQVVPVMNEFYRLAYIRKPEFMGNTRTEERDPKYKVVSDLPWSQSEVNERIQQYQSIAQKVLELDEKIPDSKQFEWFQLVKYPVCAASEMNKKHLFAQLARHGKIAWTYSQEAYDKTVALTEEYNLINQGKWNRMMSYHPRNLPVFDQVPEKIADSSWVVPREYIYKCNGSDFDTYKGDKPVVTGVGYECEAIHLAKGSSVEYFFETMHTDSVDIQISLVPCHPVAGDEIRYAIAVNDQPQQIVEYQTQGRSEEWKENVLRNQAIRISHHHLSNNPKNRITITALDEGVTIDQIKIYKP